MQIFSYLTPARMHIYFVSSKPYVFTSLRLSLHPIAPNFIAISLPIPDPAPVKNTWSDAIDFLKGFRPYSLINTYAALKKTKAPIQVLLSCQLLGYIIHYEKNLIIFASILIAF